jgi:arginine-tRNA-protein transferase
MNEYDPQNPQGNDPDQVRLSFYATPEHDCSYLPGKHAITLFADPQAELNTQIYSALSRFGFRRSGKHIYRPACATCSACIPVRIPVDAFNMRRIHRRIWKANQDLSVDIKPAAYDPEQHELYVRYIQARHADGGMNDSDPEKYMAFLTSPWSQTRFVEFRKDGKLLMVAVIDELDDGLSAVYTFFEPHENRRSLGTMAILWSIDYGRRLQRDWLYLGYLIESCPKMSYKTRFQPQQHFINGHWVDQ